MPDSPVTALLDALAGGGARVVDLTQPLSERTPVLRLPEPFANTPHLSRRDLSRYDDAGPAWAWSVLQLGEHTGTHFDAPIHWITGRDREDVASVPPGRLVGPAVVLDLTAEVAQDPGALLTVAHLEAFEAQHGRIPEGAWVLLRTGWSKRADPAAFLNVGEDGAHSPGFHKSASEFLAYERDILGVGVETVGTDAGQAGGFDPPFPNHTIMHGAGKFGLASLCNLDRLPPTGSVVIAAPLKIVNGSGSPLRVLAIAPAP